MSLEAPETSESSSKSVSDIVDVRNTAVDTIEDNIIEAESVSAGDSQDDEVEDTTDSDVLWLIYFLHIAKSLWCIDQGRSLITLTAQYDVGLPYLYNIYQD